MQQKQYCRYGGEMWIVLDRKTLVAKSDKCGRIRAASERPRPVRRPA